MIQEKTKLSQIDYIPEVVFGGFESNEGATVGRSARVSLGTFPRDSFSDSSASGADEALLLSWATGSSVEMAFIVVVSSSSASWKSDTRDFTAMEPPFSASSGSCH